MGPIGTVAASIEVDVTGRRAFEAIDKAMHATTRARLGDVEADTVAMAARTLQPEQIGSGLKAGVGAVEIRLCPLRKVLPRLLAEHTAPCPDLRIRIAAHKKLIALALVEGAERHQAKRARDRRHHRFEGDLGVKERDRRRARRAWRQWWGTRRCSSASTTSISSISSISSSVRTTGRRAQEPAILRSRREPTP